jgi:hypothetical protein
LGIAVTAVALAVSGCKPSGPAPANDDVEIWEGAVHTRPAPLLLAPPDGAQLSIARPLFEWRLKRDKNKALVQICADPACAEVVQSFTARFSAGSPEQDLPNGTYYWRAARIHGEEIISFFSETRRLVIAVGAGDGGAPPSACPVTGCAARSLPAGTDLFGIWIGPAGEVWAVGESGYVGRRSSDAEGGSWCWCVPGPALTLRAVWGAHSTAVWAVGDAGTAMRWDGVAWQIIGGLGSSDLHDVWGSSSDDVWIVGSEGTARRQVGGVWQPVDADPRYQLRGVWGAAALDSVAAAVWAVGFAPVLTPVGTDDPTFFWQGAEAMVLRWNGSAWVSEASFLQIRGSAGFAGIDGSSAIDVWAVGHSFPSGAAASFAFIAHFDGATWSPALNLGSATDESLVINRQFTDVAARPPDAPAGAWVTAQGFPTSDFDPPPTAIRFDGTSWTAPSDPLTIQLFAIDVRGPEMWAAGRDGKILRWGGAIGWVPAP